MANPLSWGNPQQYVKCGWCNRPAVYFWWERTDGRNGPVCEHHFNEEVFTAVEPLPESERRNVVYISAATKEEKAE